jgi:hypothetical protein
MPGLFYKGVAFSLPLAIYFGFPLIVLERSGEFLSTSELVESSVSRQRVLIGFGYSSLPRRYKLEMTLARRPQVLALGPSRIVQMREMLFNRGTDFYNAGGGVATARDYEAIIDRIPPGAEPKIVIVALDQCFFNDAWIRQGAARDGAEASLEVPLPRSDIYLGAYRKVWRDYFQGKFLLRNVLSPQKHDGTIGMNAFANSEGFRSDGSYRYGKFIAAEHGGDGDRFDDAFARIRDGRDRFEPCERVSARAVREFESFLDTCHRRGIHVAGFLPPYAHVVYNKMMESGKYKGFGEIETRLRPHFEQYGFSLFNFSDLADLGAGDCEAVDGFHGSEMAYLRLYVRIAANDPHLSAISNLPALERLLKSSPKCTACPAESASLATNPSSLTSAISSRPNL